MAEYGQQPETNSQRRKSVPPSEQSTLANYRSEVATAEAWAKTLALLALVLAGLGANSFAQSEFTIPQQVVDQATAVCGGFRNSASSTSQGGLAAAMQRNEEHNARVRNCIRDYYGRLQNNKANQQRWDAIPPGEGSGVYVNGIEVRKCSHGDTCLEDWIRILKRKY